VQLLKKLILDVQVFFVVMASTTNVQQRIKTFNIRSTVHALLDDKK